jgi:lipid-A-disaccharide synthase
MARKILVSAGEASGDLYASLVVEQLRRLMPDADFFGCTGPRLRAAGVRTVVDAASLAVVGLIEVVAHIPRIYGEYRKLLFSAAAEKPDLAILGQFRLIGVRGHARPIVTGVGLTRFSRRVCREAQP